jgi:hypothetical protein
LGCSWSPGNPWSHWVVHKFLDNLNPLGCSWIPGKPEAIGLFVNCWKTWSHLMWDQSSTRT